MIELEFMAVVRSAVAEFRILYI